MIRKGFTYYLLCLCTLWLVTSCGGDGVQMRQQLEALEQQNRSGEQMLNDSLAESLVSYFDKHGDANERMRAKYILGRTYYCLGELPRALETYYEAADCADTTLTDCNYKVLSRIHAQSADVFHKQVQPRSELKELRLAEYYAKRGKDTIMAINCYALQAGAYDYLHKDDSVIFIKEKAAELFMEINNSQRAAQTISTIISSLVNKGYLAKAKKYCDLYEGQSGLFDEMGIIKKGCEVYYYMKGELYLATHQIDSAEYLFRKELRYGKDLNNQIAGCKGLQKVYEIKRVPDSIAKYANLGYILNDSAYSLSEMQNIQKFQASYNFNHQKFLAEKNERKAELTRMWLIFAVISFVILALSAYFIFEKYKADKERELSDYRLNLSKLEEVQSELLELREKSTDATLLMDKKTEEIKELQAKIENYQKRQNSYDAATLEDRIENAVIVKDLKTLLESNPIQTATQGQLRELKKFINEQIPCFYEDLNSSQVLRPVEYEVCMLIRCHFKPSSVGKLLGLDDAYISNLRRRILHKVYRIEGNPKDLDERIMAIG